MLRLLNLLEWDVKETPTLLCGPLYEVVSYFEKTPIRPTTLIWTPTLETPLQLAMAWRIALFASLLQQGGTMLCYFPTCSRRTALTQLTACLDSSFPLLDKLEAMPHLTLKMAYDQRLAPELQRQSVIDYSCTSFITPVLLHTLVSSEPLPATLVSLIGCDENDRSLPLLVSLLQQLTLRREKMRGFLSTVFNILRGDGQSNWLASTLVMVVQYSLLGNYPGATAKVSVPYRRQIYKMTRDSTLRYLSSCAGEKLQERENELAVTVCLLSNMLSGTMHPESIDYVDLSSFLHDWTATTRVSQSVMNLLVDFYPLPAPCNLISDVFRFHTQMKVKFETIFHDIANQWPCHAGKFAHLIKIRPWAHQLTKLSFLSALILGHNVVLHQDLQRLFEEGSPIYRPVHMTESEWYDLVLLSNYIVDQRAFRVITGSQVLYFEQIGRMLDLTGKLSPEKSTVLYCTNCNTVRFRPVGIHLPSSHITLLADLNFMRIYCVDCDADNMVPINLIGKYVRCYLSTKKRRQLVTLTLCSACMHVCVTGFHHSRHGAICSECKGTVLARQQDSIVPKACINQCSITGRLAHPLTTLMVLDSNTRALQRVICCNRCLPPLFRGCEVPLLESDTLKRV